MDKEKILELLFDAYKRAKEKELYVEKCIMFEAVIEVILEREGLIELQKNEGSEDDKAK